MTATEDRGEAAPGGPQPTHIDVHIYQESALAKLLQMADARLQAPKLATTSRGARLLVASWVSKFCPSRASYEAHTFSCCLPPNRPVLASY